MSETTFKDKAIEELLSVSPKSTDGRLAFLSALAKQAGTITLSRKRMNLVLALNTYSEAVYVVGMLKELYPAEFEIGMEEIRSGLKRGQRAVTVMVPSGFTRQTLSDTGLIAEDAEAFEGFECAVPAKLTRSSETEEEYLRGLFLACGSVYVPTLGEADEKRDGYHFEFQILEEETAESVSRVMQDLGVQAKLSERGQYFLVYLKDKEEILKMLAVLGLPECVLELNKIINERETANSLNRVVICETANLDKTFAAASKQLLAIGMIEDTVGLDSLTPALRETARARMEYQQASMQELADILGISKSCLNHRLRKLSEIADGE